MWGCSQKLRVEYVCVILFRLSLQGISFAKEYALANGPMMIEFDTYRYHGHSMSDPGSTYRTRDEISTMRQQRDPVEHVRKLILDNGFADASDLKKLEKVRVCEPGAKFPCTKANFVHRTWSKRARRW